MERQNELFRQQGDGADQITNVIAYTQQQNMHDGLIPTVVISVTGMGFMQCS